MTFFAGLFGFDNFLNPKTVDLGDDEVEIVHTFGPVLLGEVHVLIGFTENPQQPVMGLEIEADSAPHLGIIFCHCCLPHTILLLNISSTPD
jgi:hypothetical protein